MKTDMICGAAIARMHHTGIITLHRVYIDGDGKKHEMDGIRAPLVPDAMIALTMHLDPPGPVKSKQVELPGMATGAKTG